MAPVWESLGDQITDPNVLIGEVDCTTDENKDMCQSVGVKGYPTLLSSTDGYSWNKFEGARDLEALKTFVEENLSENCFDNEELCTEEETAKLNELKQLPRDELQKKLNDNLAHFKDAGTTFDESVKKLQDEYVKLKEAYSEIETKVISENKYINHVLKSTPPSQEL